MFSSEPTSELPVGKQLEKAKLQINLTLKIFGMKLDGSKIIFGLGVSGSIAIAFVSLYFALR